MDKNINLKKILGTYLKQWSWFVLSILIFASLAFFYLRYATPEYSAQGKIMIVDSEGLTNPADLLLKDLGEISNSEKKMIEDEIEILKSRKLMRGVVKNLGINIEISIRGRFHDTQYFPNSKAPIKISTITSDSLIYKSNYKFSLNIISQTSFNYVDVSKSNGEEVFEKKDFGENIDTSIGPIVITPNVKDLSYLFGQTIDVKIIELDKISEKYKNSISISPAAEGSKVINLSLTDPSAKKAVAVIDNLVSEYNRVSIEDKSTISNNTAEFINKRIDLIASDLSDVDNEIEQFKTGNKLTNISSEASLYLQTNAQTEQALADNRTELNKVNFMKNQISDGSFERIPSNIGLTDGSLNSLASKYNELLDNRNRLLKSSNDKNPIIVNLNQQLNSLKNSLKQSLENSSKAIALEIRSLENQSAKLSSKIYAVPGQVRKSRDIEREQGIKESLYLYLLQKREEATISLISTSPNAKIIDNAHTNFKPVSPNRMIIFLASIIIGFSIPFGFFYVKDLLDTKIHNKEDLEKIVNNINVLGEIPRLSGNIKNLIQHNDRSILSESFRIIRTNFDYIRRRGGEVKKYDNVVFVTSTINSEGKSFFSMNMALTIANTRKKVLLVGADIRNPQIFPAIKGVAKDKESVFGLTEFLVDKSISIHEIVNNHTINDIEIDVLLSGKVPPNPAELLMSERVKELFDEVSKKYDYVIVDTAPSMLVTDTLLISEYAGHTIYLTRADHTEKEILNFAKELYKDNKLNNMMLVVNDVKQSNFGYGAKYGYYGTPKKKKWYSFGKA